MGRIGVDLTTAGLIPDATYTGQVQKLDYQISTGTKDDGSGKASWKKESTQDVDFTAWSQVGNDRRRLHYIINIPGKPNIFADFYMMEASLGFLQAFMKGCNVAYDKDGFDPEEAVGKQVSIEVTSKDDATYGPQNNFKYTKV